MIHDKATFIKHQWSSWRLESNPETALPKSNKELTVEDNYISDLGDARGVIAKVREPLLGSILNMFIRIVSSILPGDDFKCAYVIDFGKIGKVELYISNGIWDSHADITCHKGDAELLLMTNATREYIRYRCFMDEIQPLEN